MGTIFARKRKDGTTGYTAQIALKRGGRRVHTEAQTFDREAIARAWMKKREADLAAPGGIEKAKSGRATLGDAIDKYIQTDGGMMGRTKTQVLRAIRADLLADKQCSAITSSDIIDYARELGEKVQPQTVQNYLAHLAAVFTLARPAWGIDLDPQAMRDAFIVAKRMRLTSKSRERDRRPSLDELDRILAHVSDRRSNATVPMVRIIPFALFSTRRQDEICRITWADYDGSNGRVLVRDMKSPGEKRGNHVWCDLPAEAVKILEAMPKTDEQIFPFKRTAISAAFTRTCAILGIADLHFHDLRHEGISRLFEMGWDIPHVSLVSGHRSWVALKRYTHIRQHGDKYAGWYWLDTVTKRAN
jgi:integrase